MIGRPLTRERADLVRWLRARGRLWPDISRLTGLPVHVCQSVALGAQWPKLVTRIEEDGSWEIVRTF